MATAARKKKGATKKKRKTTTPATETGRLAVMGPQENWQVALLLPVKYVDREYIEPDYMQLGAMLGQKVTLKVTATPRVQVVTGVRPPRTTVDFKLVDGSVISATWFGDARDTIDSLVPLSTVYLSGEVSEFRGNLQIKKPEVVDPTLAGSVESVYPGKRGILKAETVKEMVIERLDEAIPKAAEWVVERALSGANNLGIPVSVDKDRIEDMLWKAHRPKTAEEGHEVSEALEKIAAMATLAAAHDHAAAGKTTMPVLKDTLRDRARGIPFKLTDEQVEAVKKIAAQFDSYTPERHLLSGDVGTGKTVVFALIAAINADSGGITAILLPNSALALQVYNELRKFWSDIPMRPITADSPNIRLYMPDGGIVIGTTALLSRMDEENRKKVSLVIVDEQQRFSVGQREELTADGAHLLEATATCIPRTLALVRYGAMQVSRLTKPFRPKHIETHLHEYADRVIPLRAVRETVESGKQALVVYPLKESEEEGERTAVANAMPVWEKLRPGRVAMITGNMTDEEKGEALRKMREREVDILVGTTVVEVGIDLPDLHHVVVTDASRLGVTQIHQLRGRAARQGGHGRCDLLMPEGASDKVRTRLSILAKTQDGFRIAEHDLALRGFGSLAGGGGAKQTGADDTFLFGRPMRVEVVDQVAQVIEDRLKAAKAEVGETAPTP